MAALLGAILAVAVVVVLLYPLIRRPSSEPSRQVDPNASDKLQAARRSIYRQVAELRNDFDSGHISADEFQLRHDKLRLDAAIMLRDEDQARVDAIAAELQLEAEVRQTRGQAEPASKDD